MTAPRPSPATLCASSCAACWRTYKLSPTAVKAFGWLPGEQGPQVKGAQPCSFHCCCTLRVVFLGRRAAGAGVGASLASLWGSQRGELGGAAGRCTCI